MTHLNDHLIFVVRNLLEDGSRYNVYVLLSFFSSIVLLSSDDTNWNLLFMLYPHWPRSNPANLSDILVRDTIVSHYDLPMQFIFLLRY